MGIKDKNLKKQNQLFLKLYKIKFFNQMKKIVGLPVSIESKVLKDFIRKLYTIDLNGLDLDKILKLKTNIVSVENLNVIKEEEKARKLRKLANKNSMKKDSKK